MSASFRQGIFNGFGTPQPKNPDQAINDSAGRFWDSSLIQDGYFDSTHMTPAPRTPMNPWLALDRAFDVSMTDSSHRRRSSALSPRAIDTLPHAQNHLSAVPHAGTLRQAIPHFFVPGPDSAAFKQNYSNNDLQQLSPHTSDVSISSSTTVVSISSSTNTNSTLSPKSQLPLFSLLLEICVEGLRRKWQEEIQRQQIQNLTGQREANGRPRGYHRRDPYHHHHRRDISQQRRVGRGLGASMDRTRGGASMGAGTAIEIQAMDYVRLIADKMWEHAISIPMDSAAMSSSTINTTATTPVATSVLADRSENSSQPPFQARARAERAALEKMQNLYSLSSSVVRAVENAAKGEIVYNIEEVKDLVGCAGRLCRVLGYWEGEATVEKCGRECIWGENGVS